MCLAQCKTFKMVSKRLKDRYRLQLTWRPWSCHGFELEIKL